MKYKIVDFHAPHVVVEYSTNDGVHKQYLNVRIDRKLDGSLPVGAELDEYILSYAPLLGQPDPYAGVDWSGIEALVQSPQKTSEQIRDEAKASRAARVAAIKVTTQAGNTFDGDEVSQDRMARAIIALNAQPQTPVPTVAWVLADNSVIQATAAELTEALTLAGTAQVAMWPI
jgi:biopolymer transport protein ExbD